MAEMRRSSVSRKSPSVVSRNSGVTAAAAGNVPAPLPPSDKASNRRRSSGKSTASGARSTGSAPPREAMDTAEEYEEEGDDDDDDDRAKPDRSYKYNCGGRNQRPGSNLKGKHVEWTATIECPLEELIYPSLQHFTVHLKDVFGSTGMTQEMSLSTKKSAAASEFTNLTPKWMVNIGDALQDESPQAVATKDRYSVTDILTRGEMHLRRRLKESASADLLLNAKGWPMMGGKPALTDTEKVTAAMYMELRKEHTFKPIEDPKRTISALKASQTLMAPGSSDTRKQRADDARATIRQIQENKAAHKAIPATRKAGAKAEPVPPDNENEIDRRRRHNLDAIESAFQYSPSKFKDISNSSFLETGGNLSVFQQPQTAPAEIPRKNRAAAGMVSRVTTASRHKLLFGQDRPNQSLTGGLSVDSGEPGQFGFSQSLESSSILGQTLVSESGHDLLDQCDAAEDVLVLAQIDAGRIPEEFLKRAALSSHLTVTIDLSNYGMGDVYGTCLGQGLSVLSNLSTLRIRDNRLTSLSLVTILAGVSGSLIKNLDMSKNDLRGAAAASIAQFFKFKSSENLRLLDVSHCNLSPAEASALFVSLTSYTNQLMHLNIAGNTIGPKHASSVAQFVGEADRCGLKSLDLSHTDVGPQGAVVLANALVKNKSIVYLNLNSCCINDHSAQQLAMALLRHPAGGRAYNDTLQVLGLARNNIQDAGCFVFANALIGHPGMRELDLSGNPVGEAGARALFRKMVDGLTDCVVLMRTCSYPQNDRLFDYTSPDAGPPFVLDMSEPYAIAVLTELTSLVDEEHGRFRFQSLMYRESPKGSYSTLNPSAAQGGSGALLSKPGGGLKIEVGRVIIPPSEDSRTKRAAQDAHWAMSAQGIERVCGLMRYTRTETDRMQWLRLIFEDVSLYARQAQQIIDILREMRVIGSVSGLTVADLVRSMWMNIIDDENKFELLCRNVNPRERRELASGLTFQVFKFTSSNLTSHWRIDLSNRTQRALFLRIAEINAQEVFESKTLSGGRRDTSQRGNWYNFRNERYNSLNFNEMVIDAAFLSNLPKDGYLEFDYVSTTRPPPYVEPVDPVDSVEDPAVDPALVLADGPRPANGNLSDFPIVGNSLMGGSQVSGSGGNGAGAGGKAGGGSSAGSQGGQHEVGGVLPLVVQSVGGPGGVGQATVTRGPEWSVSEAVDDPFEPFGPSALEITNDQFTHLLVAMGMAFHRKLTQPSEILYALLEIQLAAAKYYFPVQKVLSLVFSFDQDDFVSQAKAVVATFSRLSDLHNVDMLIRALNTRAQEDVIQRLGWLNIFNPLKPSFTYALPLTFWDNRAVLAMLLEMGPAEGDEQIKEDQRTDILLSDVLKKGASLTDKGPEASRPETVRLSYGEVAERTKVVSWETRTSMLNRCLLGTCLMVPPILTGKGSGSGAAPLSPLAGAGVGADSPGKSMSSPMGVTDPPPLTTPHVTPNIRTTATATTAATATAASFSSADDSNVRIKTGRGVFDVIHWYHEIEAADSFTSGPLDLQYAAFVKYPKPKPLIPPRNRSPTTRRASQSTATTPVATATST